ncbi:MAG: hypothetical protein PHW10_05885 [Candidatus Peribacteraceae bacterium]|nr:hypothetical protein [Candidatus Peribacteraceae bacterium]
MKEITRATLEKLYGQRQLSMQAIAQKLKCSVHKVTYWMQRYGLQRRSISDAIYIKHNPSGDPFRFTPPTTKQEFQLYGLGLGLYWGEGTKADKVSIRLGNTDPLLILAFLRFLSTFFGIRRADVRFGLQIFSDVSPAIALKFWRLKLKVPASQFFKITVTPSRGKGTYRKKCPNGVLTVYYSNTKLRRLLQELLSQAALAQR